MGLLLATGGHGISSIGVLVLAVLVLAGAFCAGTVWLSIKKKRGAEKRRQKKADEKQI